MHHHFNRQAFTLVELLVVVAIISILAAILFPVFARARENARRASCMSNLKQMGMGMMMYVQDYDETYPDVYYQEPSNVYWWQLLQPYTKSAQLFRCPSSPLAGDTFANPTNWEYAANILVIRDLGVGATGVPLKLAAVQASASTYMLMDWGTYYATPKYAWVANYSVYYLPGEGKGGGDCSAMPAHSPALPYYPSNYDDCQNGRHFGGVNITFADGHVKWLKSSEVVSEARKCGDNNCSRSYNVSNWNPLLDNS